jgi:PIN domain
MDTHDGPLPACHGIPPMTTPAPIPTAVQRLIEELSAFAGEVDQLLDASTIDFKQQDTQGGVVFAGWHDYQWGVLDDHGRRLRRVLLEAWPPLMERVRLLLAADPSLVQKRLDKLNQFVTGWLDRPGTFDSTIPATIPEAKKRFHEGFTPCLDLLGSLGQQTGATIVVPDTNVLVRSPEIGRYRQVLGADDYTVVLVAPVLAELDVLKTGRASPSVRDKARGFSNRIKEWRRRGPLHLGVTVEGKVIVRAEGREPNLQASLSWLDPTVVDDRIIACTLELQRGHPADRVVLLTGDVNLLAKADMAGIPTADTPDPDPE